MDYEVKEVQRAIRDLKEATHDILQATLHSYQSRIGRFINLTETNRVIAAITGPLFNMEIDHEKIENNGDLCLPSELNLQMAYSLQVLKASAHGEFPMDGYVTSLFMQQYIDDNIRLFNSEVLYPCFRELGNRLDDLLDDHAHAERVSSSLLQNIFVGHITAYEGSQIAVGQDISQSNKGADFSSVVGEALDKGIISHEQRENIEKLLSDLQVQLQKTEPSSGTIRKIVTDLYEVGKEGLLSLVRGVTSNPLVIAAIADVLLHFSR